MTAFHFLRPQWLLAIPPLLALLVWLWRQQLRSRSWQKVCDPQLLPHLLLGRSRRRANWPLWLILSGALLAVTALAGPAWRQLPQPLFRQQSALVILLDLSRSMNAGDLKPSRLERARLKVEDLLNQRREGQTALIAFAGDAFAVTPLTDDRNTIRALLQSLDPDLMPVQGSAPHRAIELGRQLLLQAGLKRGRLLLITDEDRPDQAMQAAGDLAGQGLELSVIGVGTAAGAPIPSKGGGFFKDSAGDLVLPKLDEPGLRQLAGAGDGRYRRLSIDDSDLRGVLAGMDAHRLDQAEQAAGKAAHRWREEGVWLLWPLVLLGALAFRRGWMLVLLLVLWRPLPAQAFSWQGLWQRPDQQAARAFAEGDFAGAGNTFRDPRWKASARYRAGDFQGAADTLQQPESADDWYNRGNALARGGQLPQALEAYDQALNLDPGHDDARANREVVAKALRQEQEQGQQGNQGQQRKQGKQGQKGQQNGNNAERKPDSTGGDSQQSGKSAAGQNRSGEDRQAKADARKGAERGTERENPQDRQPSADAGGMKQSRETPAERKKAAQPATPGEKASRAGAKAAAGSEELSPEEQRALEQWLQQIPDDPGGLLRRKFLYQYRQRGRQRETDRPW